MFKAGPEPLKASSILSAASLFRRGSGSQGSTEDEGLGPHRDRVRRRLWVWEWHARPLSHRLLGIFSSIPSPHWIFAPYYCNS